MTSRTWTPKVTWHRRWSTVLGELIEALPHAGGYPPSLYAALVEHSLVSGGVAATVERGGVPVAVVGLARAGNGRWANLTNWLLPGFVCAGALDDTQAALAALRRPVSVAWWRMPSPPSLIGVRESHETPVRTLRVADREAYWRTSSQWRTVKEARRRTQALEVTVDGPGDCAWVTRNWARKWAEQEGATDLTGYRVQERLMIARALEPLGRHVTVVVRDGDRRLAGATQILVGDTLTAGVLYRDQSVGNTPTGVRVIDAVFEVAAARGIENVNLGGGHDYKSRWAPQAGASYRLEVGPAWQHATRVAARAVTHALTGR